MPKSTFTDAYAAAIGALVAIRKERGITQVELARRLQKPQQFVSKVETCVRRIDIIEFYAIAEALGMKPADAFSLATKDLPGAVKI